MLEICDEKEKASLYFSVQDDGIGIEEEKQKLIFQNFEQADESEIARRQGTGLGLAISRRLIHMMDSEINLESELHKGSNFSFTLKLKYLENVEEVKDSSEKSLDLKEKHILIVEDNELNMEIIHTILDKYEANQYGTVGKDTCQICERTMLSMVLKTYYRGIEHIVVGFKLANSAIFFGNTFDRFGSKSKTLMFGGNEMPFLIDIQGTGKRIINRDA